MYNTLVSAQYPPIAYTTTASSPLAILAPDEMSGRAFVSVLRECGVACTLHDAVVAPPRVVKDRLSADPSVAFALAAELRAMYELGYRQVAIACNTLHLFIPRALEIARYVSPQIVSTIAATSRLWCGELWLGTTPLCDSDLIRAHFAVLSDIPCWGRGLQALCQECIWDAKVWNFDRAQRLANGLMAQGIRRVIAGCTELPVVFRHARHDLEIVDPAREVARTILSQARRPALVN